MKNKYVKISIVIILLMIIPYIVAYLKTPANQVFTGFILDSVDNETYISKIQHSENFSFQNYYNPEHQEGGYVFLFYNLLGVISNLLNIDAIWLYHASRIVLVAGFLYVLHFLLKQLDVTERQRMWMFIIVATGGTSEWIISLGNSISYGSFIRSTLDPAHFPFSSMLYTPHFTLNIILLIYFWALIMRYSYERKESIYIGFVLLFISIIHPYTAVFNGLAGGIYRIVKDKKVVWKSLNIIWFGIIPLPYLLYLLYAFEKYVTLKEWKSQSINLLPDWMTLVAYIGVPLILIVFLLFTKWSWQKERNLFSWWIVFLVGSSLIPFSFQGRLWEGIGVPILIIISWWLTEKWLDKKVIFMTITSLLIINSIWLVSEPIITDGNSLHRYISKEKHESYLWLRENTDKKAIIFSDNLNGNYIPTYGERVVINGHKDESPNSKEITSLTKKWCKGEDKLNVTADYYFVDFSLDCKPTIPKEWVEVYRNKEITIYK